MFGVGLTIQKKKSKYIMHYNVNWLTDDFQYQKGCYVSSIYLVKNGWKYDCKIKMNEELFEQMSFDLNSKRLRVKSFDKGVNIHFSGTVNLSNSIAVNKDEAGIQIKMTAEKATITDEEYHKKKERMDSKHTYETSPIKIFYGGSCSPK